MLQNYIFQLCYVIQVHQDVKAFLFKVPGWGVNNFENTLQTVMNLNSYLGYCSGKLINAPIV